PVVLQQHDPAAHPPPDRPPPLPALAQLPEQDGVPGASQRLSTGGGACKPHRALARRPLCRPLALRPSRPGTPAACAPGWGHGQPGSSLWQPGCA
ncbi:hypothetical protein HaLaN_29068, partial [Haematococcus lacustris]